MFRKTSIEDYDLNDMAVIAGLEETFRYLIENRLDDIQQIRRVLDWEGVEIYVKQLKKYQEM